MTFDGRSIRMLVTPYGPCKLSKTTELEETRRLWRLIRDLHIEFDFLLDLHDDTALFSCIQPLTCYAHIEAILPLHAPYALRKRIQRFVKSYKEPYVIREGDVHVHYPLHPCHISLEY